jgi:hypothetical protein
MNRIRTTILGAALAAAGFGLAHAQDPPVGRPAPGMGATPPPAASEPERGPIRSFFHKFLHGSKTPRSGHSDWSTGRDDKLSKPWLQPPSGH